MSDYWSQFIYTYSCYDGDDHGANNAIDIFMICHTILNQYWSVCKHIQVSQSMPYLMSEVDFKRMEWHKIKRKRRFRDDFNLHQHTL